jgi:hypothetical protein
MTVYRAFIAIAIPWYPLTEASVPRWWSLSTSTITFDTKCWEGDWQVLVETGVLSRRLSHLPNQVSATQVITNNLSKVGHSRVLEKIVATHPQARIEAAENHFHLLDRLELNWDSPTSGLQYSSSELIGLVLAETEYLVHLASDVEVDDWTWLKLGIRVLASNHNVAVVNPVWNDLTEEARAESIYTDEDFFYGYGFSDQCYLVRVADFQQPIYNTLLPAESRFPGYGGDSFEKRVDAWMRKNHKLRATCQHSSYRHPTLRSLHNLSRESFQRNGSDNSQEAVNRAQPVNGWYADNELKLLSFAVEQATRSFPSHILVEVGSYCGRSTVCIGDTLRRVAPSVVLHTIDPHEGEIHKGVRSQASSLQSLRDALESTGLSELVRIHVARSTEVRLARPIGFLHIDGLHDYDSVRSDFEHFAPNLPSGAFVAFHDYLETVPVKSFVNELITAGILEPWALSGTLIVLRYQGLS